MANKIFLESSVVRIESTTDERPIQFFNPNQIRYYIFQDNYIIQDKVTGFKLNIGKFDFIQNKFGDSFTSQEDVNKYLNEFIFLSGFGSITASNPTFSIDIDNNRRISRNTVFGDKITAKRVPQITAQFQYPLAEDDILPPDIGNGGQVIQENTLLKLKTDSQIGSYVKIQSSGTLRYIPGFECYLLVTPDFNIPIDGQKQIVGVLDEETGFGFGYNGLNFVFVYRRDGVTQYFDIDLLQFEKQNGYKLNPQKGNVYLLTYGFLGYAPAKLEVIPPQGGLSEVFTFEYPNIHDQTHLSQTFLPIRGELENLNGNTQMTLSVGSINAGIIDGGNDSEYTFARSFNYYRSDITIVENTELVAFRNKTVFGGIINYIDARLFNFNLAQDINKSSVIVIFKNPIIINVPTWNNVDNDSVLEYSEDILIDFNNSNKTFYSQALFRTDSLDKKIDQFKFDLAPGDIALFAVITTGQGDIAFSNFWKELF